MNMNNPRTINPIIQGRKTKDIPILTQAPKTLYSNTHTYTLQKQKKYNYNLENVNGFEHMPKFNPQDLGLPK